MNNYITYINNKNKYFINLLDTIEDLLSYEELLLLPMDKWIELLTLKDGNYSINSLHKILEKKIKYYGNSEDTKSFIFKNKNYWFDKNTRIGLHNLASYTVDNMDIILGEQIYTFPVNVIKEFLKNLELFSGKCYIVTQKHLNNIKSLKTVEELINYDYTKGYPNKVLLNG